ncbi:MULTISPECIES: NrsF family protein [Hyphomicrobiales]|jgi:hypothetical protein|uniref:NrsF family protein n=1 Tax=Bosea massiliensis TaxID=151419 RepID=A0ABW0P4Z2_9HYPH|nr:DUF1109 domain-containing protein [Methylobacterium sp. CCH7-A2]
MRTDDMIDLLVQDLPNQPKPVSTILLRWWPTAAALAGVGFLGIMGVRPDLVTAGLVPTLVKLMLGALIALTAIAGALDLSRPEVQAPAASKWLIAVVGFLGLVVATDLLRHGLDDGWARLFGKGIVTCLTLVPALAALPLIACLTILRRGATTEPVAAGALAGLASAGLAIFAYGLFCNEDSPLFIATWYSLAALIVGLAGAALGRAMLRW